MATQPYIRPRRERHARTNAHACDKPCMGWGGKLFRKTEPRKGHAPKWKVRSMIARFLCDAPPLPFSSPLLALAPLAVTKHLKKNLRRICVKTERKKKEGCAFLISTHYSEPAENGNKHARPHPLPPRGSQTRTLIRLKTHWYTLLRHTKGHTTEQTDIIIIHVLASFDSFECLRPNRIQISLVWTMIPTKIFLLPVLLYESATFPANVILLQQYLHKNLHTE